MVFPVLFYYISCCDLRTMIFFLFYIIYFKYLLIKTVSEVIQQLITEKTVYDRKSFAAKGLER